MSDIDYRIVQLLQSATSKAKIRAEAVLSGRETSLGKPPEVETRLITLKDAAGRLGVSRSTIGRLVVFSRRSWERFKSKWEKQAGTRKRNPRGCLPAGVL